MTESTETNICSYCARNPRSHSFKKVENKYKIDFLVYNEYEPEIFYSRPAQAELYEDTVSVVKHFELALNGVSEWEWIFDCQGMGLSHYTQFGLVQKLCKLFAAQGGFVRIYS